MKSLAFSLLRTVLDDPGATSQSDLPRSLPIQSDPLERLHKVARVFTSGDTQLALGATSRSDPARSLPKLGATCPERQGEIARHLGSRRQEIALGATSRSDPARSLPKPGATCRSDEPRSLRVSISLELMISQGPFGHFIMHKYTRTLLRSSSLGLSEYLHSQCFDIPQNWFDNLLYYNICLMSLENS
ncbi:hypothetical protein IGI04_027988 [Brassica rapa subsp. trilocularis]|uniref:Uncharacterized protein n=1 Tax=Brassica rapa subsp. trilocularis TaxID=1813537 RepID=A0ABQ7L0M4_BRACM|nr:hypothetical protein IGI04_027988 [Brassica rapa subsp. trilocularis]